MTKRYEVRDKITGEVIDRTSSIETAEKLIIAYEKMDDEAGTYRQDAYEVVRK